MFKKVVLSGLLSVAMVFSMGLGVGAEALETDEERFCRESYDAYKEKEEKYRKILEKKNKVIAKKKELLSGWSKVQKEFNKGEKSELAHFINGWSIIKIEEYFNSVIGEWVKRKNEKITLLDQKIKRYENKINRLWELDNKFIPSLKNIKAKDDARKLMIEEREYALVDPDAERDRATLQRRTKKEKYDMATPYLLP